MDALTSIFNSLRSIADRLRRLEQITGTRLRKPIGGGTTTAREPFDIILTAQASPSTSYNLVLWPGTINGLTPGNILTALTYDPTTTKYIKLKCATNGKELTGITVAQEDTATGAIGTASSAAPTSFDLLVGIIITNTIYQSLQGNKTATVTEVVKEDKATPVPGTSPYIFHYTWAISAA